MAKVWVEADFPYACEVRAGKRRQAGEVPQSMYNSEAIYEKEVPESDLPSHRAKLSGMGFLAS